MIHKFTAPLNALTTCFFFCFARPHKGFQRQGAEKEAASTRKEKKKNSLYSVTDIKRSQKNTPYVPAENTFTLHTTICDQRETAYST